jgi:hypothetical protein
VECGERSRAQEKNGERNGFLFSLPGLYDRQHLSKSAVQGGRNPHHGSCRGRHALTRIITARGLLQEMHYPQVRPTPTFTDSATSIFVANDDSALKRALWVVRRVKVLRDGVDDGEFEPIKIPEEDNASDVYTKYLVFQKWKRHSDFINNMTKTREDKALARMALIVAAYDKG